MPELPEVETIARGLQNRVSGKTISSVEVRYAKIFRDCCGVPLSDDALEDVVKTLTGKTIQKISRRAKYLLFDLCDIWLISHLRMTGRFSAEPHYLEHKHTHVVFYFTDGSALAYNDTRKFGTIQVISNEQEMSRTTMSRCGPEPLGQECSPEYLWELFQKSKKKMKALLLTQEAIAGIGNIYADEILFFAGIHPERAANSLSREEVELVYQGIREKLLMGIKSGGASILTYVNEAGEKGDFQNLLKVYGKKGGTCQQCGGNLTTATVAARTTTFCPQCQK